MRKGKRLFDANERHLRFDAGLPEGVGTRDASEPKSFDAIELEDQVARVKPFLSRSSVDIHGVEAVQLNRLHFASVAKP